MLVHLSYNKSKLHFVIIYSTYNCMVHFSLLKCLKWRLKLCSDIDLGFALGDTIESKTKGIWAWCKIHPTLSNTVLLLLDTEGLGDVEKVGI
jgi:hypothetical protein